MNELQVILSERKNNGLGEPVTIAATAVSAAAGLFKMITGSGIKNDPRNQKYDIFRAKAELLTYLQSYYPPDRYEFIGQNDPVLQNQYELIVWDAENHGGGSTFGNWIQRFVDEYAKPENFRHLFIDLQSEYEMQDKLRREQNSKKTTKNTLMGVGIAVVALTGGYFIYRNVKNRNK